MPAIRCWAAAQPAWVTWGHCGALREKDGARMSGSRRNWPLAVIAALTSTLMVSAAHARGGGHAGAVARSMTPTSHMGTMLSPGVGLSGVRPALSGAGGTMRAHSAAVITPPAMVGTPQTMQTPIGASAGNGSASRRLPQQPWQIRGQGQYRLRLHKGPCRHLRLQRPRRSWPPSRRCRRSCRRSSPPAAWCSPTWRCRRAPPRPSAPVNRRRAHQEEEASRWPTAWGSGIARRT